jgi:hypothetical protein
MKIKQDLLDILITCPFTGKLIHTIMLDPELYIHYFNCGYHWLFDNNTDNKAEIELDKPDYSLEDKGWISSEEWIEKNK